MKKIVKYITAKTLQPLAAAYISRQRIYRYKDITLQVPKTVFHPALFFSTKLLLGFMDSVDVAGKTFLELGAGSGLIAMHTARRGAQVTASDINSNAVEYLQKNSVANNIAIEVVASNLFDEMPTEQFDIIAINPPYYKKDPTNDAERAWYCGANSEYFYRLFATMGAFIKKNTAIYMVLCEGCDIALIKTMAEQNQYLFTLVRQKKKLFEMNYIFKIQKCNTTHV